MKETKKLDYELFKSIDTLSISNTEEIWTKILSKPGIEKDAVRIVRNSKNDRYTVYGGAICDLILVDYEKADKEAYETLINEIYANPCIAREKDLVTNKTYLEMALSNDSIKLGDDQKEFAVKEAMGQYGTAKRLIDSKLKGLFELFDGEEELLSIPEVKTKYDYLRNILRKNNNVNNHSNSPYDIRYFILKNKNWTDEEKKELLRDFWTDEDEYMYTVNMWEDRLIEDNKVREEKEYTTILEKDYLYEYSYPLLLEIYKNENYAKKISDEIVFLRKIRQLRKPKIIEKDKEKELRS